MKKVLLIVLGLVLTALVSGVTSYLVTRAQANVKFVFDPTPDNPDHGYLQINDKNYYQLYTTTEIKDSSVPAGSHYHAIDLRGEN